MPSYVMVISKDYRSNLNLVYACNQNLLFYDCDKDELHDAARHLSHTAECDHLTL